MQPLDSALAQFVHRIDPMLLELGPVRLWYYGLAYCVGFLGVHFWFCRSRSRLGLSLERVYDLTLLFTLCVLLFGRAFEIVVYEWDYYVHHPHYLASYWRGGMASHGVLLGGVVGIWLFCRLRNVPILRIADEVVIPGALFLALGRVGNFVNGHIYGAVTDGWWGVQFPDSEGFRHPVTLYESLKNIAIIPILLIVRRGWHPGSGVLFGHFVFWYGFLRIFTDYFREYGTEVCGIGTGQYFNVLMAVVGAALILWRRPAGGPSCGGRQSAVPPGGDPASDSGHQPPKPARPFRLAVKRLIFVALLLLALMIPSGWTRGVLKELRRNAQGHVSPPAGGIGDAEP